MSALDRYDGAGFPEAMAALKAKLLRLNRWHLDQITFDAEGAALWRARAVYRGGAKADYLSGYGTTPAVALVQLIEKLTARYQL